MTALVPGRLHTLRQLCPFCRACFACEKVFRLAVLETGIGWSIGRGVVESGAKRKHFKVAGADYDECFRKSHRNV